MDDIASKSLQLEEHISEIILNKMEQEELSPEDALSIIDYCNPKTTTIKTQEELNAFLTEISTKWPFFASLANIEKEKAKDEKAGDVVENIADIAQAGNIDEALNLARTVTNN